MAIYYCYTLHIPVDFLHVYSFHCFTFCLHFWLSIWDYLLCSEPFRISFNTLLELSCVSENVLISSFF